MKLILEDYVPGIFIQREEGRYMYELTKPQQLIYSMDKFGGEAIAINMASMLLTGECDKEALKKAIKYVYKINEAFWIKIYIKEGRVLQKIEPYEEREIQIRDFANELELREWVTQKAKQNISIDGRLSVIEGVIVGEKFGIVGMIHHIISDGWTLGLIAKQFTHAYKSICRNEEPEIMAGSYVKYIEKEKEYICGTRVVKDQEYWHNQLEQCSNLVSLTNKSSDKLGAKRKMFSLDQKLIKKLEEFCKTQNVTPFVVLMKVLGVYIGRCTGENNFYIGSTLLNRGSDEEKNTVGMFVDTVALPIKIDENQPIGDSMNETRRDFFKAFRHQKFSYNDVLEYAYNNMGVTGKLYDVMLNYQIALNQLTEEAEVELYFSEVQTESLCIHVLQNKNNTIDVLYDYQTERFEDWEIEKLHEHFFNMVSDLIGKGTEAKISEISAVDEIERAIVLDNFNNTKVPYPSDKTIVELFEEQGEINPDKVAVIFEEEEITYAQLNARANKLAKTIRNYGIKQDDFVVIMAERSIEVIVGILSILKAGGAYVPIDPGFPKDRIQYIIEDCEPKVILVGKAELPIETQIPMVDIFDEKSYSETEENLERVNSSQDLAYTIYTSGTTGKPKGVMIKHQNIIRLVRANGYIPLDENTVILQTGALSFDASTLELWGSLANGGKLVLVSNDKLTQPNTLKVALNKYSIETLWLTASLYNQMVTAQPDMFSGVKMLLIGGEKLSPSHVKLFKDHNKETRLVNGYGPTESTTFTTLYEIPRGFETIPIGKPYANTQVYILNGNNPCGIGMPGELCIAGAGIARGYLKRRELTAEKFIDNPFGEGKLYRSGDLARWLPDGNIDFLGRMDEQVKIRGFRIELGEIESVIRDISYVKDTAVIVREDAGGEKSIYGYIVSEIEVDFDEIRRILHTKLPDYMVPTYMMQIDKIPLTRNGKLDKRVLPQIEVISGKEYVEPKTEIEKTVINIFEQVLGTKPIGVKDDFFEIGGHSLRATRVVNMIESATGVRLPLKIMFEKPTAEELSLEISKSDNSGDASIPQAEKKASYLMSSAQKRMFIINEMDRESVAYNMPVLIETEDEIDIERVKETLAKLIKRHEALRTCFSMQKGEAVQKICEELEADFEYKEIDYVTEEGKKELLAEFVRPFNLGQAPLMRMKALKIKNGGSVLLFDMHHIISDGMSANILIDEFSRLYNGETLEELRVQYKDYSEWQNTRDMSVHKEYWVNEFKDDIPVLDLITDFPRPQLQSSKGNSIKRKIDGKTKQKIEKLCQETGTTEYMVLLSVMMVLLNKYSRQEDIVIGSPVSGRTHRDTESMLGMFVNTLAMRGQPVANKSFKEFLNEIKEKCLKAYEHQEYPFEELVEAVEVKRDTSRNPIFDLMFSLQNNEATELSMDKLKFRIVEAEQIVSKFDMCLDVIGNDSGYDLIFEYCTDLFRKESIERMFIHYVNILSEIIKDPCQLISDISVMDENERRTVLEDFNNTRVPYSTDKTIVELFEEQVEKSPDNTAVILEGEEITYAQLNTRANRLAGYIRSCGVKQNDLVAVMTERTIEVIVGIFAILKAGGAYVPIDPEYPKDRIKYMLEDCEPKAILVGKAELQCETQIPLIDLFGEKSYSGKPENPERVNSSCDLAYIIYTSGTTGNPKGVMIEHRSLHNLIIAYTGIYNLTDKDIVLQAANMIFDQSVWDIFNILMIGGILCLISYEKIRNPQAIEKYCNEKKVTVASFTPMLINELNPNGFPYLRLLDSSGEAANINALRNWIGKCEVINTYGPTEITVNSSSYTYEGGEHKTLPIGKPIANTQAYILDGIKPCGIGVAGELCIAGAGVGRGYLKRPELTAEKFVKNPFGTGNLYRSGDLARWLPDGNIEYLGRMDEQVKIRGFRIELGEIESLIRKIPDIQDAAVIVREDAGGEKSICAYIVSEKAVDLDEVRRSLRTKLPDYMIPAYMMQIEKIQITRSGKLDRKALPVIKAKGSSQYAAPETETEKKIAKAMQENLNIDKLGIDDSFFEIGGDSIKAMRVVANVSKDMDINIMDIFKLQTVRQIAEAVDSRNGANITRKLNKMKELSVSREKDRCRLFIENKDEVEKYQEKKLLYSNCFETGDNRTDNVLLTGATGYLGIHILHELLNKSDGEVYLIIRGNNDSDIDERLNSKWEYYFGNKLPKEYQDRIHYMVGDISKERLGLAHEEYIKLSDNVESIINCAANVSHYCQYQKSYEANVQGVLNLIELAKEGNKKVIHHMSTISVAAGNVEGKRSVVFTEDSLDVGQKPDNVYINTKLQAEKALLEARKSGLETNIYRIGDIQCQSATGVFQDNAGENAFISAIKALIDLKIYPSNGLMPFDFSCVDHVAEACRKLISNRKLHNEIYHVLNKNKLSMQKLMESFIANGYEMVAYQMPEFINQLIEANKEPQNKEDIEMLLLHSGMFDENIETATQYLVLDEKTSYILENMGFKWKRVDNTVLTLMTKHLEQVGFLKKCDGRVNK